MSSGLPIEDVVPQVREALAHRGMAVLTAPPGSGKTTVIPLRLLDEPWVGDGKIVMLEPRRIATRAAARRMAETLGEPVGQTVGYVTRDDRSTSRSTRIEVVTEGILTRRIQQDPSLSGTAIILFDEVHERNLQTDLGLALVLDSRGSLRPDLRILVMSATIDADRIAGAMSPDPVPVISADARTHPIDVRWSPVPRRARLEPAVAGAVVGILDSEEGDILVFLPGMGEIQRARRALEDAGVYADIRILHGSLPPAEQDLAIEPSTSGKPKVVLSTDIAETSLTVEGVRIVIDSGLARAPRFDAATGMTRLRTIPISKASADQRAGRAGRTEPGVAIRMWSKLEHAARSGHIEPEITQVDLAGFMLELATWGTIDPADLTFLDPPPARSVEEAIDLLDRLGAIDDGRITDRGRAMSRLPLHPRLARMVVDSGIDQALACSLAAVIDERDVLSGRPGDIPSDLTIRLELLTGARGHHPAASGRRLDRVRRTARDLMRRAEAPDLPVDPERAGPVLGLAFPDRLAIRRGSRGRFQLRTGTSAWMQADDPLAGESFLIAADVDGRRKDARIRLAAPIDAADVADLFEEDVTVRRVLDWHGDRLVERHERRLGGITLDQHEARPDPAPDVTAELMKRLAADELRQLNWTKHASALAERVAFLHRNIGEPWPDWSQSNLIETVDEWLAPYVVDPTGLDDLARADLTNIFRAQLPHPLPLELERLAPTHYELRSGRRVPIDYSGESPSISVRVQELYGVHTHPMAGGAPLVLELLSPANRPIQITSDLPGFWTGSWSEVRKDMAGRYPKHEWPETP